MKEAIILAGGMGTRLRSVVSEVPKPMAPVSGKPFLEYLFHSLRKANYERVVLSTGYLSEVIEGHFGNEWEGMEVVYSVEETPLGTGGGMLQAFEQTSTDPVLVLNGDSYFGCDLEQLWDLHVSGKHLLTVALREMHDFDRYGTVQIGSEGRIVAFQEKQPCVHGYINTGVYLMDRRLWGLVEVAGKFSFEQSIMERYVTSLPFRGAVMEGYFIDIGIPEDFERANLELPSVTGLA